MRLQHFTFVRAQRSLYRARRALTVFSRDSGGTRFAKTSGNVREQAARRSATLSEVPVPADESHRTFRAADAVLRPVRRLRPRVRPSGRQTLVDRLPNDEELQAGLAVLRKPGARLLRAAERQRR